MPDPLLPPARRPSLRAYQARVLRGLVRAIASGPAAPLTVMMPRQSGKNEIAAALVAYLLRTHALAGGTVVVCAPTLDPQARISAERLRAALAATDALVPPAGRSRSRGDAVTVGRARAVLLSANPQASVAGHTASIALIADEAQDIDEDWFNRQFRPMAASTGAPTILFGTAWNGRTLLERAAEANRARDAATPLGPRCHHQAGWREVAAVLPAYGAYVEAERERLGASHPLFLSQYELVPGEVAGRLVPRDLLAAIEGGHDPLAAPEPGERYVAGLDFGGEGADADATVLTIARLEAAGGGGLPGCAVVAQREWRGQPYSRVLDDIRALDGVCRFDRLSADATGLGAPLVAQLRPQVGARLDEVVFTATSKSALGYALLAAARTGRLALPRDDGSPEAARCRAELAAWPGIARAGRPARLGERPRPRRLRRVARPLPARGRVGGPAPCSGREGPPPMMAMIVPKWYRM